MIMPSLDYVLMLVAKKVKKYTENIFEWPLLQTTACIIKFENGFPKML